MFELAPRSGVSSQTIAEKYLQEHYIESPDLRMQEVTAEVSTNLLP